MQYIQFILESNSNKRLDAFSEELISHIKKGGSVKAGPIPFKNKRMIYCYHLTSSTLDRIMSMKEDKKVSVTINSLFINPQ